MERNRSESQDLEEKAEEEITEVGNGASQQLTNLTLEHTQSKGLFSKEGDCHKVWKPKDMEKFYQGVMPIPKWKQTCHQHKNEVRAKTAHNLGKFVPSSDSSNKLHLSPKGNRRNLVTRYKQPPIPSKEVFSTSGQQQKSDLSPKSSAGSKEHCRQGISPEVEGSTNL